MASVGVEERRLERRRHVVGEAEAEHVGVEADGGFELGHHQDDMAEAEAAGHEPADVAAGGELAVAAVGAAEQLDPMAGGVEAVDHARHPAALQLGLGPRRHEDPGRLELAGGGVEGGGVGHLPAVARTASRAGFDGDAVVTVVHSEVEDVTLARHDLHAEDVVGEPGPVVGILGCDAQVAKRGDVHRHN